MTVEATFDMAARVALESHGDMLDLHARALACHCECLGMNAENSAAICAGEIIPYNDKRYGEAMEKWNSLMKKGNLLFNNP